MSFRNLTEEQIARMLNTGAETVQAENMIRKAQFSQLEPQAQEDGKDNIHVLNDVEVDLQVELGDTNLKLREVIGLYEGQVIALNRTAGDTVDLKANNEWLAHGEILVLNEVLGIRISSFNKEEDHSRSVK